MKPSFDISDVVFNLQINQNQSYVHFKTIIKFNNSKLFVVTVLTFDLVFLVKHLNIIYDYLATFIKDIQMLEISTGRAGYIVTTMAVCNLRY